MAKFKKDQTGNDFIDYQIARFDGKDCFVEILDSMVYLEKPKFVFKFIKYNPTANAGSKYVAEIPIYLDVERADALASMILYGTFARMKHAGNSTELFKAMGGTTKEVLAKYNKTREDGMDESRQLVIEVGRKTSYAMKAVLSAGKKDEKGLIVPQGKPEKTVIIGFSDETIIAFARAIQRKVQAMDLLRECDYQRKLKAFEKKQQSLNNEKEFV